LSAPVDSLADTSAGLPAELLSMHPASYGWAMTCTGRERDRATDVLQQAYLKVLDGRARYDGQSSMRTWFFGVIRFTAVESRRGFWSRWLTAPANETELPADERDELAEQQTVEAIVRALQSLPERQREVLHLTFYEDLSLREAAEVMAVSIGTASQHYDRGKTRLAALLTERGLP
jgi:RNA polymerase sigma factor (sigma-70 family)